MASSYEVEAKMRVGNATGLMSKLEASGVRLETPVVQHDRIFVRPGESILKPYPGFIVSRVRTEDPGSASLSLKQHGRNELEVAEHESSIADPEAVVSILTLLGLEQAVQVRKSRRIARFDNFTLCVDDVDGLGNFVELEQLLDVPPDEGQQTEVYERLSEITGGTAADRVLVGYDTMLLSGQD